MFHNKTILKGKWKGKYKGYQNETDEEAEK